MKVTNKIVALLAALALSAMTVACGNTPENSAPSESASAAESSASAPAESAPAEAAPTGEKMTEEEYKAKVLELFTNVTKVAPEIAAVDQNDAEALIAATKKVAEVTKASYSEMSMLNAPDSLADAHANIKEGATASVELLDISLEMVALGQTEMTEEEATAKLAEYQPKIAELSATAAKLNEGLIAVLGADVVGGAAAAQ